MHVKHGLPCLTVAVHHRAVPGIGKTLLTRHLRRGEHQMAEHFAVFHRGVVQSTDMLERHEERVQRRLRVDVQKTEAVLVFMHHRGGNFALDDFAEKAVRHGLHVPRLNQPVATKAQPTQKPLKKHALVKQLG